MTKKLTLKVGLKTDPIEYRYSFDWLLRLLRQEGISDIQLGTFFEIYQLPDSFFIQLRKKAEDFGVEISSVFTSHRELGGFFYNNADWEGVARKNYERLIKVGSLVGAKSVGSNPGAVLRDQMGVKQIGVACYLRHMKELMRIAKSEGLACLTIEPMSCLAEPPTLPEEMRKMAEELQAHHQLNTAITVPAGYCVDVAHGYADKDKIVQCDNIELLEAALPYTTELHLKNTDSLFNSTFGFTEAERARGIVDIGRIRQILHVNAAVVPVETLIGYVEVSGPKVGRDYSDHCLEGQLRETLAYIKEHFLKDEMAVDLAAEAAHTRGCIEVNHTDSFAKVKVSPSLMCADLCHLAEGVNRLEQCKADFLHIDIMDGHFVPNMPMGLEVLKRLKEISSLPLDVHLMVENNDFFVSKLAEAGAYQVSIHAESSIHLDRSLDLIRKQGMKAGLALNPATPICVMEYVLDRLDFILLMTVNPGFAGQKLVPSAFTKIKDCRAYLDERGIDIPIEVDGNVSFENIPNMVGAGADILVAGSSSVYHKDGSLRENMKKTQAAIELGLLLRKQAYAG
jgi:ribulose-phosphate 3-epimerase